MKKMIKIAALAVMAAALTQSIQALPFATGGLGFGGSVTLNNNSANDSTAVTSFPSSVVTLASGTFTGISGAAVMTSGSWFFNSPPGAIVNPFWQVGGYTFNLVSSYIFAQGGIAGSTAFVTVDGTGTVTGPGIAPTTMTWSFTTQDPSVGTTGTPPNPTYTFSASSNTVPDGASTAMLLGLALSGVALLKRKMTA